MEIKNLTSISTSKLIIVYTCHVNKKRKVESRF